MDAVVSDHVVREEARALAEQRARPPSWLNESARAWVPPRSAAAERPPSAPGLTVHRAPVEHLLAMKLVALRPQDAPDVVALAERLELGEDPASYQQLLRRVYRDDDVLQILLGVPFDDVADEALRRGETAVRLLLQERQRVTR
ncbi:hypothetical protein [Angustibacter aerolatus]